MRAILPFILVALGLFTAGCIAYIAWELSADKKDPAEPQRDSAEDRD
jgi:hypothetical protein